MTDEQAIRESNSILRAGVGAAEQIADLLAEVDRLRGELAAVRELQGKQADELSEVHDWIDALGGRI